MEAMDTSRYFSKSDLHFQIKTNCNNVVFHFGSAAKVATSPEARNSVRTLWFKKGQQVCEGPG